jgi:hypothetical protein
VSVSNECAAVFIPSDFNSFKWHWPGLTLFIVQVVKGFESFFRARNHEIFSSVACLFGVVAFGNSVSIVLFSRSMGPIQ